MRQKQRRVLQVQLQPGNAIPLVVKHNTVISDLLPTLDRTASCVSNLRLRLSRRYYSVQNTAWDSTPKLQPLFLENPHRIPLFTSAYMHASTKIKSTDSKTNHSNYSTKINTNHCCNSSAHTCTAEVVAMLWSPSMRISGSTMGTRPAS